MIKQQRTRRKQQKQRHRNYWITHTSLVLAFFFILWIMVLGWVAHSMHSTHSTFFSNTNKYTENMKLLTNNETWHADIETKETDFGMEFELEVAREIPGIELQIPSSEPNQPPIHIVYAPARTSSPKGLALLLHACGHSALKFFSPFPNNFTNNSTRNSANNSTNSNSCPTCCPHCCPTCCPKCTPCTKCIGLSEELRIVRLLLERGYLPVAISSMDQSRGCWVPHHDESRIQDVLNQELFVGFENVIAIGASMGGSMAAHLLVGGDAEGSGVSDGAGGSDGSGGDGDVRENASNMGRVRAAIVMVMDLRDDLIQQLKHMTKTPMIYFAPMPRDTGRMKKVIANYQALTETTRDSNHYILLDTTSCDSLPITTPYLLGRVPSLTPQAANTLIEKLTHNGHMDASTHMLVKDPTRSNWRELISPENQRYWRNTYDLKPGVSPLAKALHRAWAYHEYCSEVIVPALDFFEKG